MALKRTCTQSFRDTLSKAFPGLNKNQLYWRHLNRLLHCSTLVYFPHLDQELIAVPISQEHIAHDFKAISKLKNNNLVAINYIEEFRQAVFAYQIIEYDYNEHRCRYAVCNFSSDILRLVEEERNINPNSTSKRVLIETGHMVTSKTRTKLRKEDKALAASITKYYNMPTLAIDIQQYLNELPINRFSRIAKHIPEALDAIYDRNPDGSFVIDLETQKTQQDILMAIKEQPQPFYIPSSKNRTVRLFEINKGLQGVHSHIRRVLTQDCVEIDIQNAHLAIVAKLWGMEDIQDFLRTGKSIWQELLPAMGFSYPNPVMKSRLKDFFYGLIYGMGNKRREMGMTQVFGPRAYDNFLNHWTVRSILNGRNDKLQRLAKMKTFTTPLGKEEKVYCYKDKYGEFQSNLTSLLSQEANDYEMLLLEPIFKWAQESEQFFIILYQFDGLTIDFARANRKEHHLKEMKKLVEDRAKELGIETTLIY